MTKLKAQLRRQVLGRLKQMSASEREQASAQIVARFLGSAQFAAARTIMAYDSFGVEVHTRALLEACLKAGKILGLPRTGESDLSLSVHRATDLAKDLVLC